MKNNNLGKTLKNYLKNHLFYILTVTLLIILGVVFSVIDRKGNPVSPFKNLSNFILFEYVLLLLVFVFKSAYKVLKKFLNSPQKNLFTGRFAKKKKQNNTQTFSNDENNISLSADYGAEIPETEKPVPAQDNEKDSDKADEKFNRLINIIFSFMYLFVLAVFIIAYVSVRAVKYPIKLNVSDNIGIVDKISVNHLFAVATCLFINIILRKWIFFRKKETELHLLTGTLLVNEIIFAVTLLVTGATLIFRTDFVFLLNWLYWLGAIYLIVALAVNVVKSVIKKQLAEDFDYSILYVRQGGKGIIALVETNTGLNVKSIWSMKYFSKILPFLLILVLLIVVFSTSFYVVNQNEKAVVYRLGKMQNYTVEPGLHAKLPYPFDEVEILNADRMQSIQIGYVSHNNENHIWGQLHDGGEEVLLLGSGNELVSINVKLIFNIRDVIKYLKYNHKPEDILSSRAYEIMMDKTIGANLDTLLSTDRVQLSKTILKELNSAADELSLGITVKEVVVESIHPPVDIAVAYQKAVSAGIEKKTLVTEAQTKAKKIKIEAETEKIKAVNKAKEEQHKKITKATREMAVYYACFEAYAENSEAFKLSKYLDTYEKVIEGQKVYVFSPAIGDDLSNFLINYNGTTVPASMAKKP